MAFDALGRSLDYPMLVVTARADGEADGCLVGFWSQCSLDPLRVMVFLSGRNRTFRVACRAKALVAHVLRVDDLPLARHFGELTGDDVDKLDGISWTSGPGGAPVLSGLDWFGGPVLERTAVGDHVGFLLDVTDAGAPRADEPQLGYAAVRSLNAGHDA
ncbi:MAG: flavin reductase family protein [Acidimicrobiia bacterium]